MRGCLAIGEYLDLVIEIAALTKITAIKSILGFGVKCLEAFYPRRSLWMDLIVVWIDMTGPFPIL
jgi:hypothetical protein